MLIWISISCEIKDEDLGILHHSSDSISLPYKLMEPKKSAQKIGAKPGEKPIIHVEPMALFWNLMINR